MKKNLLLVIIGVFLSLFMFICFKRSPTVEVQAHEREILDWQQKRLARLMRDDGWLTLAGLFWLNEGPNPVGTDSTATVILPKGKAPGKIGTIVHSPGMLYFEAAPNVEVLHKKSPVTTIPLKTDADDEATILTHGTLSFYVIKRGDKLGVRVKDTGNPTRLNFKGLEYFPIDPKWRFDARFEPYSPARVLEIPSAAGTIEKDSCPGALVFEHEGTTYRIDAIVEKGSENQFFIMFMDESNGKETYEVGRQLYTDLPDSTGSVVLDFNRAYNWPCVFTDYATCPIPPKQNHLPFRVEAGEKMYRGH